MPTPALDDPGTPEPPVAPTITARDHVVTGTGFLPNHEVTIRITRSGEEISDYLTYVTDGDGHLYCELPKGAAGTSYIAATDHRPDLGGMCGRLWSNNCTLVVADT
jgi:hypothetical protein